MTELILLRHGKTAFNESNTYCGRSDPPLSAQGIAETKCAAGLLKPFVPDWVYASDKRRALQSARIAAPDKTAVTIPALREMDFGDFEGLGMDEIARLMPADWQAYLNDPLAFTFPGGDSVSGFLKSAYEAVCQIVARHDGQRVLIVTHMGVVLASLSFLLHGDFKSIFHYKIRPSGFARLDITNNHSVLSQLY